MDISVVIPIYNEENNIPALHERLSKVMTGLAVSYEFIYVNDGSADRSISLIKKLRDTDNHVNYIDFSRNFGHQIAVSAGLDKSKGDAVVIIDADLQDPPELIADLYKKLKEGNEVVYAKRRRRKGESFMKLLTAKAFYRILSNITSISIPVDTGDFRIIDRKVVDVLKNMPEKERFLRGQISWIGFNQTFVEYDRDERQHGTTGYTYRKMLKFALDGITSFSDFPLKFATVMGFTVSIIAFILILWSIYARFFLAEYQKGWASLMISILFIGGIQLIGIGIIGEYISRMSANVRNRPMYIIKDTNIKDQEK